jgi:hypothetical protein
MSTDDPGVVGPLHSTFAPTAAPAPAPFFVVRFEQRAARRQREVWSYVYVPSARAMPSDAFGEGPIRWQDASLISANLPDLTRLDPYPAATAWRSPRNGHHDVAWEPLPTAAADANPASLAWGPTALGQSQTPWALVGAVAALSLIAGLVLGCGPKLGGPERMGACQASEAVKEAAGAPETARVARESPMRRSRIPRGFVRTAYLL